MIRLRLRLWMLMGAVVLIALGLPFLVTAWRARMLERRHLEEHALMRAAEVGDTREVVRLIANGLEVDCIVDGRYPWTPLMHAAAGGHRETVVALLDRGADPRHQDLDGDSAITVAARNGLWDVVLLLARRGADVNQTEWSSRSAIDMAREAGRSEVVEALKSAATAP